MRSALVVGAAVALSSLVACGQTETASSGRTASIVVHLSGSRAKTYRTLDELAAASSLIVSGTTGSRSDVVDEIDGIPFSGVKLKIDHVYGAASTSAASVGDEVTVRFTGSETVVNDDIAVIEPGTRYLMFLTEFRLKPDDPGNGQYVIVGADSGMFRAFKADVERFERKSVVDVDLPSAISASDLSDVHVP